MYARKIVCKEKDCEVRTLFGSIDPGDRVLIYASSPIKAVLGMFTVSDVFVGRSEEVRRFLEERCTMFDEDNWRFFEEHYSRSSRRLLVIVIDLESVEAFEEPVTLETLRRLAPGFRPPMSYTSIDPDLFEKIVAIGRKRGSSRLV